jgi:hypothetical protein
LISPVCVLRRIRGEWKGRSTDDENPNEGVIRVDVEVLPAARKLSEFATREEAEGLGGKTDPD